MHFGWIEVGSFFFPLGDQKIPNVRSNPSYDWSWRIASAGPIAEVTGEVGVGLAGFKGAADPWTDHFGVDVFRPFAEGAGFQFDVGSASNVPLKPPVLTL